MDPGDHLGFVKNRETFAITTMYSQMPINRITEIIPVFTEHTSASLVNVYFLQCSGILYTTPCVLLPSI